MYRYTMYRDRIELNQQLNALIGNELNKDAAATHPGRKVLLAAREIAIPEGITFELSDCDLVLVADKFDASKGIIKIKVTDIPGDGMPGFEGRKITVLCKEVGGINVNLKGGTGGIGVEGAPGAPGVDGIPMIGKYNGGNGGKGGKGGTGGTGGKGGNLSITFLQDKVPGGIWSLSNILLPGGDGGQGGPGGPGGEGGAGTEWCKPTGTFCVQGTDGKTGPQGDTGNTGQPGVIGSQTNTQLAQVDAFWQTVGSLSIPDNAWAAYRLQVGEYFFRSFNAENPGNLALAFNEFSSVLFMDPQNAKAITYRNQILNNQNIFGLSRDIDIIPDFARYESVYTGYFPIVNSIFDAATNMLLTNVSLSQKQQDLQREISNFSGVISALTDDLNAANIGKEISVKESTRATQRLNTITKQIQDKKQELENAHVEVLGAVIGTVGLVASVVAAIPTGGMSLMAAATSVASIAGTIESSGVLQIIGEVFKPEADRTAIKELEKQAKGLSGYVSDVSSGVKKIISFPKALEELWTAKIDNAGYKKLIADSLELAYQQLTAQMRQNQAEYTAQAASKRLDQGKINKANAEQQLAGLINDIKYLEGVSLTLISMAQYYMNILTKYAFFGARALEIYTLQDKSNDIRYDYGYIHPDREADYKTGFLPLSNLIGLYRFSWSKFAGLISYREQYDNYFNSGNWVNDLHRLSFTNADALNDFKIKPELHFTIRLEDLPPSRYEAKVTSVYVAFVGATSNSNTITAIIEHSGRYSQKKRDTTAVNVLLKPRAGVVVAKITPLQSSGGVVGGTGIGVDFWGKGIAADWHLYIEPSEMQNGGVNLSGLTEIQVWLSYQSFLLAVPFSLGSKTIKDGILLRDPVTQTLYVTSGGAKLPVPDTNSLKAKEPVDDEEILLSALPTVPKDDTLLREANSDKVYIIKNGVKLEIKDNKILDKLGVKLANAKVVPEKALSLLPYGGVAK